MLLDEDNNLYDCKRPIDDAFSVIAGDHCHEHRKRTLIDGHCRRKSRRNAEVLLGSSTKADRCE